MKVRRRGRRIRRRRRKRKVIITATIAATTITIVIRSAIGMYLLVNTYTCFRSISTYSSHIHRIYTIER
ncbi:hypothetical protein Hanom_Chr13g01205771 [Helianthus anomalus]